MTDASLEVMFEGVRAAPPKVPDALMARVLADAETLQPKAQPRGWRGWFVALGGVQGMGGLITASCVGFWLGVAPPAGVPDLAGPLFGLQSNLQADLDDAFDEDLDGDALTAFGWDIEEG